MIPSTALRILSAIDKIPEMNPILFGAITKIIIEYVLKSEKDANSN